MVKNLTQSRVRVRGWEEKQWKTHMSIQKAGANDGEIAVRNGSPNIDAERRTQSRPAPQGTEAYTKLYC